MNKSAERSIKEREKIYERIYGKDAIDVPAIFLIFYLFGFCYHSV